MMANSRSFLSRVYNDPEARQRWIEIANNKEPTLADLSWAQREAMPVKGIGQEKVFSQKRRAYRDRIEDRLAGMSDETREAYLKGDPERFDLKIHGVEALLNEIANYRHEDVDDHALDAAKAAILDAPFDIWKGELHTEHIASHKLKNKSNWKTIMSEQDQDQNQTHLNIQAEDGQVEIIHRYGQAPQVQEPKQVSLSGTIEAPSEYFEKREKAGKIDTDKAHLEVDQNAGTIALYCNPHHPMGETIRGKITMNPLLRKMRINDFSGNKFNESDFILLIKETRSLFSEQKEAMNLVDKINNLEMEVNKKIDRSDNERGGRKDFYEQTCEDELPAGFNLSTNIFVGSIDETQEHTFYVEIKYHYGSQLHFWLESPEMEDIVDTVMEKTLGEEINKFEEKIPVIYT